MELSKIKHFHVFLMHLFAGMTLSDCGVAVSPQTQVWRSPIANACFGSPDVFCACSGYWQSQLWSSCDNLDILHIHLRQSGMYPHFSMILLCLRTDIMLYLPLPWMPFCVKMDYKQNFPACANHMNQLGVIL